MEAGKDGGLNTILRPISNVGAWSTSLDGDLDPGEEWVGLICARDTNMACVLGYPARIYWFANRRFRETVRLGYSLAP